jgi:hypothetical protein
MRKFQPVKRISIETINGERASQSAHGPVLRTSFDVAVDYQNLTLYRKMGGILATTGPAFFSQIGDNEKPAPSGRIDKIHLDGFCSFKKIFVDNISDTFLSKNLVVFAWFIQSQAQGGPRSATLVEYDPDGRDFLLISNGFLDHLTGLFRHFKHGFLL